MRDDVDAHLTKTFRDVAVPEGLAERLLAGLAAERPRPRSRRWLFAAGGLAAAAATVLLAVWLGGPATEPVSEDSVRNEAIQLFNSGVKQPGYPLANGAPSQYPFSPQVVSIQRTNWRHISGFLGSYSGVVYDLPGPPGARAALYVVACNGVAGLGQSPDSPKNAFTTASSNCCASAWQEGGLLYVLVVEGDQSNYGRYLNLPSSPIA
jgi:hypothetical protein